MKKIVKFLSLASIVSMFLPVLALAATVNTTWIESLITSVGNLVALLIPIVIAIGLLFFIWGLVTYIAASGDEAAKEEGKRKMIWGIIALFVIVAVWGLVNLLGEIVGVEQGGTVEVPEIPGQ